MTAYSSGSRYFGTSSASKAEKAGDSSEGLSTQALPAAMAAACGSHQVNIIFSSDRFVPRDGVTDIWDN